MNLAMNDRPSTATNLEYLIMRPKNGGERKIKMQIEHLFFITFRNLKALKDLKPDSRLILKEHLRCFGEHFRGRHNHTAVLCVYVADPATFLGTVFPSLTSQLTD